MYCRYTSLVLMCQRADMTSSCNISRNRATLWDFNLKKTYWLEDWSYIIKVIVFYRKKLTFRVAFVDL